jgi:hypothetical protein
MKKNFLILFSLVFICLPIFALAQKVYDVDFADGQTLYLHSGTKTLLRINQIPGNLDSVQLSVIDKPSAPKAIIVGKRLKSVNNTNNSSHVEFLIDIEEIPHGTNIKQLIHLELKTFRKSNDRAYEVIDRYKYFIRPITCSQAISNVCGSYQEKCNKESSNCSEDVLKFKTFSNECEMTKFGADYFHDGVCFESTI